MRSMDPRNSTATVRFLSIRINIRVGVASFKQIVQFKTPPFLYLRCPTTNKGEVIRSPGTGQPAIAAGGHHKLAFLILETTQRNIGILVLVAQEMLIPIANTFALVVRNGLFVGDFKMVGVLAVSVVGRHAEFEELFADGVPGDDDEEAGHGQR